MEVLRKKKRVFLYAEIISRIAKVMVNADNVSEGVGEVALTDASSLFHDAFPFVQVLSLFTRIVQAALNFFTSKPFQIPLPVQPAGKPIPKLVISVQIS